MGLILLSLIGLGLAAIGGLMLAAPRWARIALRVLGFRWEPHPASRVAAWGLIVMGLMVTILVRVVR